MATSRAILMPLEDKEECLRALDWTLKQLYRKGDTIHFLHVIITAKPFGSDYFSTSEPNSPLNSAEHSEALESNHSRAWIRDRFVPAVEEAGGASKVMVLKAMSSKAVGDIICQKADELNAAVVVMTADKRGGVSAFYEGSNIHHCVQHCSATVLAWRPE